MRAWEITGICIAVTIGAAVGAAYIMIDAVNRYVLGEETYNTEIWGPIS